MTFSSVHAGYTYTVMEVRVFLNKCLQEEFVVLLQRCLGDDGLNVFITEMLCTLKACDARIAGIDTAADVSVETLSTGGRIVVMTVAVDDREGVWRLVYHAGHTSKNIVRGRVDCGRSGLLLHCAIRIRKFKKPLSKLWVIGHVGIRRERKRSRLNARDAEVGVEGRDVR